MTTQTWTTLPPMKEKRYDHAVCLQGDRIIVAGGDNGWECDSGSGYLDTCEAFGTKSKRFVLPHPCRASHHCQSNAYSVNVNLPFTCSSSTLPRLTAKRGWFSLLCLPPGEGGLIAIGGFIGNGNRIGVVESLDGEGATEWRRLAPLPLPLDSLGGGVYSKQRILVVGGETTGYTRTSATLAFTPPTAAGLGQWVTLKPRPEFSRHINICGNSIYLVSKFTFQHNLMQHRLIFKI